MTLPAIYEWTGPTGVKFRDIRAKSGAYYHDTTPPAVVDALESCMNTSKRVRMWYGDNVTGKNWYGEYHMVGHIAMSMGPHKIPLLISRNGRGGPAILADCIVCMQVNGVIVYKHPLFAMPVISIYHENAYSDIPWAATVDGDIGFARFKTELSAKRWAQFMRGERAAK